MRRFKGRKRKLWAMLVALVVVALALPGCSWIEGREYYLTFGNGVYVNLREPTTRALETQLMPACKWDRYCVARFLHDNVHVGGLAGDYWRTATSYANDLWLHALEPAFYDHTRCPTFHIDLTNDINWETHHCHW